MTRLPDDDVSFYLAAAGQLPPHERPAFEKKVVTLLQSHPDPGPGTVNAVVRTVLAELRWAPAQPRPGAPPRGAR